MSDDDDFECPNSKANMEAKLRDRKIWLVTLTREITVPVYADSDVRAVQLAHAADDFGRIDWIDAEKDAEACPLIADDTAWDDDVPLGLDDEDHRTIRDIRAGVPSPEEWATSKPASATPAALVEWLARAPGVRSWWGAVDGGAATCNGYAVVWAKGATGPDDTTTPWGRPWREAYAKMLASLGTPQHSGRVMLESLRAWLAAFRPSMDDTRYGAVFSAAVDRRLVERWVLPFVEIDGACEVIVRAEQEAVEWRGDGWIAHVMPVTSDGALPEGALEVEAHDFECPNSKANMEAKR